MTGSAKQSRVPRGALDCFVACAPRNDGCGYTFSSFCRPPVLAVFHLQIGMLVENIRDLRLDRRGEQGTGPVARFR